MLNGSRALRAREIAILRRHDAQMDWTLLVFSMIALHVVWLTSDVPARGKKEVRRTEFQGPR